MRRSFLATVKSAAVIAGGVILAALAISKVAGTDCPNSGRGRSRGTGNRKCQARGHRREDAL